MTPNWSAAASPILLQRGECFGHRIQWNSKYGTFLFTFYHLPVLVTLWYHKCMYVGNFSGVTILLSLTVFLNLVAESMPTTSDAVPLIGMLTFRHCLWGRNTLILGATGTGYLITISNLEFNRRILSNSNDHDASELYLTLTFFWNYLCNAFIGSKHSFVI